MSGPCHGGEGAPTAAARIRHDREDATIPGPGFGTLSIEITAKDAASRRAVIEGLPAGTEVFVADLPDQPPEVVVEAAAELRAAGFEPVPHLVAGNIAQVGTAGPADRGTLADFARDLGAGPSAARLARPESDPEGFTPDRFATALAEARAKDPALGLEGLHLFPFGRTEASVAWLRGRR